MSILLISSVIIVYLVMIFAVSFLSNRNKSDNTAKSFFTGQRKSPWFVVAVAMVGTSISGVTFLSVPGMVLKSNFSYMQMVLGFLGGYFVISFILIPLYYRMNLCSIYQYLDSRFGNCSYKVGSVFFIISKYLGCAVRMYLTAVVLQLILFEPLHIPFVINVFVTMGILYLYTFRGGVKTLVWVDLVQTCCMIAAVVLSIVFVCRALGFNFIQACQNVAQNEMSRTFYFDNYKETSYFLKQFFSGMFTAIAMTGLDQDMMQKNLSCKNIKEAQKNVMCNALLYIPVNLFFLFLGVLLYMFASKQGLLNGDVLTDVSGRMLKPDQLYAYIATGTDSNGMPFLPVFAGSVFTLGLVAAAFSSGGSALTSLTTSVTVDILRADKKYDEQKLLKTKNIIHGINTVVMGVVICCFAVLGNTSVISAVYLIAGYTYGPLLGLFTFGLCCKRTTRDKFVPIICIVSPIICFILNKYSEVWFGGYKIGFEILLINAGLTMLGLFLCSLKNKENSDKESVK